MAKAVRLSDIAKELNVSTVTVSKALSGQKGVSEELREKILSLAEEMGYKKTARKEEEKKTDAGRILGVIVAERFLNENQSFYWLLYQEVSKETARRSAYSMLEVISYDAENNGTIPRMVQEGKIDGLVIMGDFRKEYVMMLDEHISLPQIYLDTTGINAHGDCVVTNNLMGGYFMTSYLLEMGHRQIGYVGTKLATNSIDDRYLGYRKAMMEHGIEVEKDWVLPDRNRETGKVDMEKYFPLPEEMPTAFFCNCDLSASLLIRKLQDHGYSVPEDVSVVGFDNYVSDQIAGIGITTYEISTREMGRKAVHILMHKITNEKYTSGMFVLPGKFILRESAVQIGPPVPFA